MADEDRDPDGRAGDAEVRQAQDLAVLADDLPLFLRVAVGQEDVDLGQRVERDRMGIDARPLRLAADVGPDLALELGQRVGAGAGDGLVGVDHDPLEPDAVAQRHQDRGELHRRAVRIGDDAGVALEVVGVDLRDDERHLRVHPPGGRVVDDRRSVGDGGRRQLERDVTAGREQRDVDAVEGRRRPLRRSRGSGPRSTRSGRPTGRTRGGAARRPGTPAR